MPYRGRQVQAWLWLKRKREPSHRLSITLWLEMDRVRLAEQTPHVALSIPIDGFVSKADERVRPVTAANKKSVYLDGPLLSEIETEALRLRRPLSKIVQEAWKIAKRQLQRLPAVAP